MPAYSHQPIVFDGNVFKGTTEYRNQPQCEPMPQAPASGVSAALAELAEARRFLEEQYGELYQRLTPICVRDKDAGCPTGGSGKGWCEVANIVGGEASQVRNIAVAIRELVASIDI